MGYRVGIDIGGTFTDFVFQNKETGEIYADKLLTTYPDPSVGLFHGFDAICTKVGIKPEEVTEILHGTTLATNAVIERRGVKTGLITTKGFRNILDIRRSLRYDQYDLKIEYPPPLVPVYLRREVTERVYSDGKILTPIKEEEVRNALRELIEEEKCESIAVCFLNSYINSTHEGIVRRIAKEMFPGTNCSLSSEIRAYMREYERTSTVCVNSYVQPLVADYLERINKGLSDRGVKSNFCVMTCSGGLIELDDAKVFTVLLLESGPVAGVLACEYITKKLGLKNAFSFDMGGTTAKGSIIDKGVIYKKYEFEAARFHRYKKGSGIPILVPNVDLLEIGGGGGSIAWLDKLGLIRVGPQSASSDPGPASYGRGGKLPTVTDADLILGYLNPEYFLGGDMPLYPELANKAINKDICEPIGINIHEAAWGIHEKANEDIATAFRLHARERGIDYREFVFVAFGGAAPVHCCRIAKKLHLSRVILPFRAGLLSSIGLLIAPLSFDFSKTLRVNLQDLTVEKYLSIFTRMINAGKEKLKKEGIAESNVRIDKYVDMRYVGQGFEIEVDLPHNDPNRNEFESLTNLFEKKYEKRFGLSGLSKDREIVNFKCSVSGPTPVIDLGNRARADSNKSLKGYRPIYFGETEDYVSSPVYDRRNLTIGMKILGPAVVEERESTCVLPPGAKAHVDRLCNIVVDI